MSVTRINMTEFDNETVADTRAAEYQKMRENSFQRQIYLSPLEQAQIQP